MHPTLAARRPLSVVVRPRMCTLYFIILLLTASCYGVFAAETLAHVEAFSKLKQGDTLIVHFHTSGCFHNATYEFTFHRVSDLTVSIVQLPDDATRAGVITPTNRVELGTLTLAKSDATGLDRLMDFYRSKHDSFCTTVDNITFTQQRDGKKVVTEQIRDDSCQTYQMKRITRFPDLIARLRPQKR